MAIFKVWYDDDADAIIDEINSHLKNHGLEIICDDLPHDGYNVYEIKRIDAPSKFQNYDADRIS